MLFPRTLARCRHIFGVVQQKSDQSKHIKHAHNKGTSGCEYTPRQSARSTAQKKVDPQFMHACVFYQLSFALLHLTLADSIKVLLVAFQCANMCCSAMEEATAQPTLTSFSFSFPLNHFIFLTVLLPQSRWKHRRSWICGVL
mgnify:CR=1 FL=1